MHARTVSMSLKAGVVGEFTEAMESRVIPLLLGQEGFQDQLTLIAPDGREVIGVSLWTRRADADRYGRSADKEVMKRLAALLDGAGTARTLQVSNSTFHKIGPGRRAKHGDSK